MKFPKEYTKADGNCFLLSLQEVIDSENPAVLSTSAAGKLIINKNIIYYIYLALGFADFIKFFKMYFILPFLQSKSNFFRFRIYYLLPAENCPEADNLPNFLFLCS